MRYDKPIQHGELVLKPIKKLPQGTVETVGSFIGAPSTSGHHHVLKSKAMRLVRGEDHNFIEVVNEGVITQTKDTDRHPDLPLPVGIYQLNIKTEYDIFDDVIRKVQD
jgi:hypothetical protein